MENLYAACGEEDRAAEERERIKTLIDGLRELAKPPTIPIDGLTVVEIRLHGALEGIHELVGGLNTGTGTHEADLRLAIEDVIEEAHQTLLGR